MQKLALSICFIVNAVIGIAQPGNGGKYLVTETQFGAVEKKMSYTDLVKVFGAANLKDERRSGAEGEGEYKVTVIYKNKPQEVEIAWAEKGFHKKIVNISASGVKSPYYTKDSLKIGSTLTALLKVNKAPLTFYGFEWDYGGLISNFHNGTLAKSKVAFTLGWYGPDSDTALLGDGEFESGSAQVKKRAAQVKISKMEISFE